MVCFDIFVFSRWRRIAAQQAFMVRDGAWVKYCPKISRICSKGHILLMKGRTIERRQFLVVASVTVQIWQLLLIFVWKWLLDNREVFLLLNLLMKWIFYNTLSAKLENIVVVCNVPFLWSGAVFTRIWWFHRNFRSGFLKESCFVLRCGGVMQIFSSGLLLHQRHMGDKF